MGDPVVMDAVDWAIRGLQAERCLTMRQMILIFRAWSAIMKKRKRLTRRELKRIISKYEKERWK